MNKVFDIQAYFPESWPMKEKKAPVVVTTDQTKHSDLRLQILPAQYLLAKTR